MTYPAATIARVIGEQYGFLTETDVNELLAYGRLGSLNVLLRYSYGDVGREVVKLADVPAKVEAAGDRLRDVSFTADEHARLREHG